MVIIRESTFIYVEEDFSLENIEELLQYYEEITSKTGEQLDWNYSHYAFPYTMERKEYEGKEYFLLNGKVDRHKYILIGVHHSESEHYIQITIPEHATFADKNKANEIARFLAKKVKGNIRLFSGKIQQV